MTVDMPPDAPEGAEQEAPTERPKRSRKLSGEAVTAQQERLAVVRFTARPDYYRRCHMTVDRHAIKAGVIELLRQWGPEETPLIGKQAIASWFASMGIGNRLGQPPTWSCIVGWRKRLHCPIWRGGGPKSPPWSTDVLLRSWLLSLFSTDNPGGPRVLREHWHPSLRERKSKAGGTCPRLAPSLRAREDQRDGGAIAPCLVASEMPKPATEPTATANPDAPAEYVCRACGWRTTFRSTRCPLCTCLTA